MNWGIWRKLGNLGENERNRLTGNKFQGQKILIRDSFLFVWNLSVDGKALVPSLIENGILSVKDSWWQQKSLGIRARRVRALRKHLRVKLFKNMHLKSICLFMLPNVLKNYFQRFFVGYLQRISVLFLFFILYAMQETKID